MDEVRFKKSEIEIVHLKRRADDHDKLHETHEAKLKAMLDWKASIEESTEVNRRVVEIGEGILQALSWVGVAARWVTAVGLAFTAIWMGIKGIIHWGAR